MAMCQRIKSSLPLVQNEFVASESLSSGRSSFQKTLLNPNVVNDQRNYSTSAHAKKEEIRAEYNVIAYMDKPHLKTDNELLHTTKEIARRLEEDFSDCQFRSFDQIQIEELCVAPTSVARLKESTIGYKLFFHLFSINYLDTLYFLYE